MLKRLAQSNPQLLRQGGFARLRSDNCPRSIVRRSSSVVMSPAGARLQQLRLDALMHFVQFKQKDLLMSELDTPSRTKTGARIVRCSVKSVER
jgi:hypothetical protein